MATGRYESARMRVYSHVTPTMQREAATTLDRLLGGA
jgi:hypothetical protein